MFQLQTSLIFLEQGRIDLQTMSTEWKTKKIFKSADDLIYPVKKPKPSWYSPVQLTPNSIARRWERKAGEAYPPTSALLGRLRGNTWKHLNQSARRGAGETIGGKFSKITRPTHIHLSDAKHTSLWYFSPTHLQTHHLLETHPATSKPRPTFLPKRNQTNSLLPASAQNTTSLHTFLTNPSLSSSSAGSNSSTIPFASFRPSSPCMTVSTNNSSCTPSESRTRFSTKGRICVFRT